MTKPAKSFELDCGHVRWFRHYPDADDQIWCPACHAYQFLRSSFDGAGWVYWADWDFKSRLVKRGVYDAECTYQNGDVCGFELSAVFNFKTVRNMMHHHYMLEHTNRGIVIRYADRIEGNVPPF